MKKTILYAEDYRDLRDVVKMSLEDHGYNVVAVEDGLEALIYINSAPVKPDLILSDYNMPNMDGGGLVEMLRFAGNKIPIIINSGGLDAIDDDRLLGCHFADKPITEIRLMAIIKGVLNDL